MNITSDKRKRTGSTVVSEGVVNAYSFEQEAGMPVMDVRVETSKNGNKVLGADYMGASNRLLIDIVDYKYLTTEEIKATLSAIIGDINNILTPEE